MILIGLNQALMIECLKHLRVYYRERIQDPNCDISLKLNRSGFR